MASSITYDQRKQFARFVGDKARASALGGVNRLIKLGVDKDGLQRVLGKGPVLEEMFTQFLLNQIPYLALEGYDLARSILGDDLITPEEIMKARPGIGYSHQEQADLLAALPNREELEHLKKHGFMLVAGPPKALSLLDIRALKADYFYTKEGGWYADEAQKFSREEKVGPGWHKIRKEAVPDSFSKTWEEQQKLIGKDEFVPNDAMIEWCVTTYHAVRGVYLLRGYYVRTASVTAYGSHVDFGDFDPDGLYVAVYWDHDRVSDVGVLSARK